MQVTIPEIKLAWRPIELCPKGTGIGKQGTDTVLFQGLWSRKRTLSKIWMKNRPVSNSQNSYIASMVEGNKTKKKWIIHPWISMQFLFFMPLASEPIVNFSHSRLAYCSFKYWTLFLKKKSEDISSLEKFLPIEKWFKHLAPGRESSITYFGKTGFRFGVNDSKNQTTLGELIRLRRNE